MSRRSLFVSVALLATLGTVGSAWADDLSPPPWRFNPGTTVQHWDFSSGPAGFAPDALPLNNPFGSPAMSPAGGAVWLPGFGGRQHVWAIGNGALTFDVPNTGVQTNQKELWLQVTFFGNAPTGSPNYTVAGPTGPFTQIGSTFTPLPGGWTHELSRWRVSVCPPFERIAILPGFTGAQMFIDQVVIDTQCVIPSPGAGALLAVAGVCAVRRRRGR